MRFVDCPDSTAFTRTDLLVLVSALGVFILVAGTGLAHPKTRSHQAVCANNLAGIGQGLALWSNDHADAPPWRVPVSAGGTATPGRPGNVWFEFAHISNYLATPRLLVCPADAQTRRVADDFSDRAGGLLHFSFRGNAVSYVIGLDPSPGQPSHWICADRNIRVDYVNQNCSSGMNNAAGLRRDGQAAWTNGVHESKGNVLHLDGRVSQYGVEELRASLNLADDNGTIHLLMPR